MALEFIGYVGNNNSSETILRSGPVLDIDHVETVAKAHENAGFDRALLAFHSDLPDPLQVGQHIASVTQRLNVFIAQRPGFTAPTVFARQFATLDHLTKGRISLNVITGGDHAELVHDGNTVPDKDERYARTSEFLDVVRAEWTSDTPFDYDGKYYQVKGGFSQIKPLRPEGIPVFVAGASDAAIEVAGRHADIFALWGETYEEVRSIIARVRAAAAKNNRPSPRFSLSFRPILAETEELAWAKADAILARAQAVQELSGFKRGPGQPANEGSRRLLALAAQGERLDKRLWTGLAKLTGARGNSTSLVGTPQQVAEALLDYYALGVDIFLIRGFDPLVDAIEYGRELIPLTRELVARREAVAA
ncbi:LLM class flavin-dependent oxidoreductase [Rhodopseudomonas palustris]|uniref:LLM class flavin-dependent oxidoreductase n=1 Tax=Rhodopseudomonas palustris TaxID=1076 RepID=UPI0020CDD607|nr:LLM class flavin-dependent oxidoreductase [Rhodopseudomonas palustris]MCP9630814.1 LLM class flavin-dependent oxidoreductase [Rhodopseudomonas palustris]